MSDKVKIGILEPEPLDTNEVPATESKGKSYNS